MLKRWVIICTATPPKLCHKSPSSESFFLFLRYTGRTEVFFLTSSSSFSNIFRFFDKRCYVLNLTTSLRVLLKYCWILILLRNTQFVWCIITKTKVVSSLTFFVYLNDFKTHQLWGIILGYCLCFYKNTLYKLSI